MKFLFAIALLVLIHGSSGVIADDTSSHHHHHLVCIIMGPNTTLLSNSDASLIGRLRMAVAEAANGRTDFSALVFVHASSEPAEFAANFARCAGARLVVALAECCAAAAATVATALEGMIGVAPPVWAGNSQ